MEILFFFIKFHFIFCLFIFSLPFFSTCIMVWNELSVRGNSNVIKPVQCHNKICTKSEQTWALPFQSSAAPCVFSWESSGLYGAHCWYTDRCVHFNGFIHVRRVFVSLTWPEQPAAPPPFWSAGSSAPLSEPGAPQSGPAGRSSQHPVCAWPSPAPGASSPPSLNALKEGTITCVINKIHKQKEKSNLSNNY